MFARALGRILGINAMRAGRDSEGVVEGLLRIGIEIAGVGASFLMALLWVMLGAIEIKFLVVAVAVAVCVDLIWRGCCCCFWNLGFGHRRCPDRDAIVT